MIVPETGERFKYLRPWFQTKESPVLDIRTDFLLNWMVVMMAVMNLALLFRKVIF